MSTDSNPRGQQIDEPKQPQGLADLPPHVDLVWHGVNDDINLRQFVAAPVPWAELDVNLDPQRECLILRHDDFDVLPRWPGEPLLDFAPVLARLVAVGKSIKIDFKIGGAWIEQVLTLLDNHRVPGHRLWLNASLSLWDEAIIRRLAQRYPLAIIQVPISSLLGARPSPEQRMQDLLQHLARLNAWGINRFSVNWQLRARAEVVAALSNAGYPINLYGIQNLAEFIDAVTLRPASVTADFNFPQWGYYGRGSGHRGLYYEYTMHPVQKGCYRG